MQQPTKIQGALRELIRKGQGAILAAFHFIGKNIWKVGAVLKDFMIYL